MLNVAEDNFIVKIRINYIFSLCNWENEKNLQNFNLFWKRQFSEPYRRHLNHFQPIRKWLVCSSVNNNVSLSLAAVLELFLQTFDWFFLSRSALMSFLITYIFLPLMFSVLLEKFCLIALEGYQSLLKILVNAVLIECQWEFLIAKK